MSDLWITLCIQRISSNLTAIAPKLAAVNNSYQFKFAPDKHNARLRGWQRTTTKLKHNNRNHRGSMGLETPRVDSPS
ncbi:hypothetical protein F7J78_18165 [Vibrio cholerae]|nr:hypothetical protein [Vibrio cholerae]